MHQTLSKRLMGPGWCGSNCMPSAIGSCLELLCSRTSSPSEQQHDHRQAYQMRNDGIKNIAFGYLPALNSLPSSPINAQPPLLTPGQLSQSLQTLSLTRLHSLHSTSSYTSVVDNLIVWVDSHGRVTKSLVTNSAMVLLSDDDSSTPSTFLLHVFRSEGELRRETDLHDRLKGSDDAFFAYDGIGAADTAEEVGG